MPYSFRPGFTVHTFMSFRKDLPTNRFGNFQNTPQLRFIRRWWYERAFSGSTSTPKYLRWQHRARCSVHAIHRTRQMRITFAAGRPSRTRLGNEACDPSKTRASRRAALLNTVDVPELRETSSLRKSCSFSIHSNGILIQVYIVVCLLDVIELELNKYCSN